MKLAALQFPTGKPVEWVYAKADNRLTGHGPTLSGAQKDWATQQEWNQFQEQRRKERQIKKTQ